MVVILVFAHKGSLIADKSVTAAVMPGAGAVALIHFDRDTVVRERLLDIPQFASFARIARRDPEGKFRALTKVLQTQQPDEIFRLYEGFAVVGEEPC